MSGQPDHRNGDIAEIIATLRKILTRLEKMGFDVVGAHISMAIDLLERRH